MLSQMLPPFLPERKSAGPLPPLPVPLTAGALAKSPQRKSILDQRWQCLAAPLLGNTVTEITLTGPREITLVRKSHLGFTGFELVMLTRWLNDPHFPLFGYKLPADGAAQK